MLQLVTGSGNAKYVWCYAPNSTCPGVCFLPICLSSCLFSSLTQRHGVDGMGRSAHSSWRQEESHSGKNYWKMWRSFRRCQLHKPILAPTALPHTVMTAYWDPCNPAPHLWSRQYQTSKKGPRTFQKRMICSACPCIHMNSPNIGTWQQVLALHELAGEVPSAAAPTPKGGICSQSKNFFLPAWFVLCQQVRTLCDPGSTGSVEVWPSLFGKVTCMSLLIEEDCNATPAWMSVTVWGLPALQSVFLLTPSNLECDKSKPGPGLAPWPSTVKGFRLLQSGVRS